MKVLIVATVVKKHIMEFHLPTINMLKSYGCQVDVAASNDYENKSDCIIPQCDNYYDIPFSRNPLSFKNIKSARMLNEIIKKEKYDIVHCHTPVAAFVTRLVCQKYRKNGLKVYYTAHGFHFFRGAPLVYWVCFFPLEWFCSFFTDILITINQEDFAIAKKCFHAKKTSYIHGIGIDIDRFRNTKVDRDKKREELGIPKDAYLLLSVGELNKNKNHVAVINSLKKINDSNIHYAIAGEGELREYLESQSNDQIHFLGYRNDCNELYKIADMYVSPSKREGLPIALLEARAAGLECKCYPIRGNNDVMNAKDLMMFDRDNVLHEIVKEYGLRGNEV